MSGPKLALRRAELRDSPAVLSWRNDLETVRQSISGQNVDPESHLTWFRQAIESPNTFLLIAESVDQGLVKAVGMCRFQRLVVRNFEVSINLAPEFRGQGWGQKVLKLGLDFMKRDSQPGDQFSAVIHQENLASRRIFEKARFKVIDQNSPWLYLRLKI